MSDSSARRRASAPLLAVGAGLVALLVAGCGGEDAPAQPEPSTLAEVDTEVAVPRLEFCALVPDSAVADALGAEPTSGETWEPGDTPEAGDDSTAAEQSVQEVGCAWSAGRTTARAWTFAEPVSTERAERLVAAAGERRGCEVDAQGEQAAYGDPSVRQRCEVEGGGVRVRYAGLFDDTWLTCELEGPAVGAQVDDRSEQWCVEVLGALDPDA